MEQPRQRARSIKGLETSVTQQKNFTGAEGLWVRIRRDPYFYFLNKVVSIVVATFGAWYTLSMG